MSGANGHETADDPVWAVGRVTTPTGTSLWPSRRSERAAAASDALGILAAHEIGPRDAVVVVSLMGEGVQFVPIEDAIEQLRAVVMPVDATARDAGRLASFVRNVTISAVVGLGRTTVDALRELDGGLALLRRPGRVLARSEVHDDLAGEGVTPFACDPLGPTLALECPARQGPHVTGGWRPVLDEDEIVLERPGHDPVPTGVHRPVDPERCACGSDTPRLVVR